MPGGSTTRPLHNRLDHIPCFDWGEALSSPSPTLAMDLVTTPQSTPINTPVGTPVATINSPTQTQRPSASGDPSFKRCETEVCPSAHGFQRVGAGGISQVFCRPHDQVMIKLPLNDALRMPDEIAEIKPAYGNKHLFDAIQSHAQSVAHTINQGSGGRVRMHVEDATLSRVDARAGTARHWNRHENPNDRFQLPLQSMLAIKTTFCAGQHYLSKRELLADPTFSDTEKSAITHLLQSVHSLQQNALASAIEQRLPWIPVIDWKPENILIARASDHIVISLIDAGGDSVLFGFNEQNREVNHSDPDEIGKLLEGQRIIVHQNSTLWETHWGF